MSRYDNEHTAPLSEEFRDEVVRHIATGQIATDNDVAEADGEGREGEVVSQPKPIPRWLQALQLIATGEILIKENVSRGYNYLVYIALSFLISIVMLFSSLHHEIRRNRLAKEVTLLHEQAVRTRERLNRHTSHSAIVEELQRRGIELYDPVSPLTIIEE